MKSVTIIEAKRALKHRDAFAHSFSELGFKTRTYHIPKYQLHMKEELIKTIKWGDIVLFMGAGQSVGFHKIIPNNIYKINYQTEPFMWWNWHQRSNGWDLVLDLYKVHTKYENAKNVVFFPGGYSPMYETTQKNLDLFDYYFVGGPGNGRRLDIIKTVRKKLPKHRIEVNIGNCWGEQRDLKIKSSKINGYLMARPEQYFCPNHMLMVVCKQKFYLHEKCKSEYGPYKPDKHFIEFDGIDDFVNKFKYWVSHDKEREEFAKNAYLDIKENHSMTKRLEKILNKHYRGKC